MLRSLGLTDGARVKRLTLIAAGLLAGAASATSVNAQAKVATFPELAGGPVAAAKLGGLPGYRFAVLAAQLGGHAVVALVFERVHGGAAQTTTYRFSLPLRDLRIGRNFTSATLDTRSGLGRFGRIRMTFRCRRQAARSARRGCTGSPRARGGTMTGVLDVHTAAGRIRGRRLASTLALKKLPLPTPRSGANPGPAQPTTSANCRQSLRAAVLAVTPAGGKAARDFALVTFVAARPARGPGELVLVLARQRPPATEIVMLDAVAPRSARLGASGIPFLAGHLSFARTAALPGCRRRGAIGKATGSLRAATLFGTVPILPTRPSPAILIAPARR